MVTKALDADARKVGDAQDPRLECIGHATSARGCGICEWPLLLRHCGHLQVRRPCCQLGPHPRVEGGLELRVHVRGGQRDPRTRVRVEGVQRQLHTRSASGVCSAHANGPGHARGGHNHVPADVGIVVGSRELEHFLQHSRWAPACACSCCERKGLVPRGDERCSQTLDYGLVTGVGPRHGGGEGKQKRHNGRGVGDARVHNPVPGLGQSPHAARGVDQHAVVLVSAPLMGEAHGEGIHHLAAHRRVCAQRLEARSEVGCYAGRE